MIFSVLQNYETKICLFLGWSMFFETMQSLFPGHIHPNGSRLNYLFLPLRLELQLSREEETSLCKSNGPVWATAFQSCLLLCVVQHKNIGKPSQNYSGNLSGPGCRIPWQYSEWVDTITEEKSQQERARWAQQSPPEQLRQFSPLLWNNPAAHCKDSSLELGWNADQAASRHGKGEQLRMIWRRRVESDSRLGGNRRLTFHTNKGTAMWQRVNKEYELI